MFLLFLKLTVTICIFLSPQILKCIIKWSFKHYDSELLWSTQGTSNGFTLCPSSLSSKGYKKMTYPEGQCCCGIISYFELCSLLYIPIHKVPISVANRNKVEVELCCVHIVDPPLQLYAIYQMSDNISFLKLFFFCSNFVLQIKVCMLIMLKKYYCIYFSTFHIFRSSILKFWKLNDKKTL